MKGKLIKILVSVMMVFSILLLTNKTKDVNAEEVNVSIVLKDDVTDKPIKGVTFDFYKVDLLTGAETLIGPAVTDDDGIAFVMGDGVGKYVAKYKSGLDDTIYDIDYTKDVDYEITVTSNDAPGVQLREKWAQDFGKFTFRDVISDGDYAVVSGQANELPLDMPGNLFEDGQPRTLEAGKKGIGMKINCETGKIAWINQYEANYASYSVTKTGDSYIFSNYNSGNVIKVSNDGTASVINVVNIGRVFDIHSTNDGGFVYLGDNDKLVKYDANGNNVFISGSLGTGAALKSVYPTSDGNYLISGGVGDDHGAMVAKVSIAPDGTPTVLWKQVIANQAYGSRFNDCMEVTEGGKTYYMASGNVNANKAASFDIDGTNTTDGQKITVKTSTTLGQAAALAKLDENGKFVWVSTFVSDGTSGESQFNAMAINSDDLGGYSVAGKTVGTVHVDAEDTTMGAATNIISTSKTVSDAVIARFDNNGRYVDSYLYGAAAADDQYYGIATYDSQIIAVGNDASKNVVCLDLTITSPPRVVTPKHDPKYVVEYYGQNATDDDYTLIDSVTKYGTAGDDAEVDEKTFTGYTLDSTKTTYEDLGTPASTTALKIVEDGTLKIKLYYDAKVYTIEYDNNGGEGDIVDVGTYRFNSDVQIPDTKPTKEGYLFKGWKVGNVGTYPNNSLLRITSDIAATANGNNVITLTAIWEKVSTPPLKKEPTKPTTTKVSTGDDVNAGLYMSMLMASLVILMMGVYTKIKKQKA